MDSMMINRMKYVHSSMFMTKKEATQEVST